MTKKIEPLYVNDNLIGTKEKLNEVISALNSLMKEPTFRKDQVYWWIETTGNIAHGDWADDEWDAARRAYGNVFTSRVEAESARDKVRDLLLSLRG